MKILSCGAGMQSTALALMACENANSPGKDDHMATPCGFWFRVCR